MTDLGATQTGVTCYLDWVNFGSFKYQESADGSTGWSDIGAIRTVEKDPMHGVYRRVDEITMGGEALSAPMDIPGVGRMGVMRDSQGAVFAVIKLEQM